MNQVIYVLTFAPTPFNGALTWLTNCHTPFVFLHFVHPGPGPGLVRPLEEVVRCNAIGKSVSNNSLEWDASSRQNREHNLGRVSKMTMSDRAVISGRVSIMTNKSGVFRCRLAILFILLVVVVLHGGHEHGSQPKPAEDWQHLSPNSLLQHRQLNGRSL